MRRLRTGGTGRGDWSRPRAWVPVSQDGPTRHAGEDEAGLDDGHGGHAGGASKAAGMGGGGEEGGESVGAGQLVLGLWLGLGLGLVLVLGLGLVF